MRTFSVSLNAPRRAKSKWRAFPFFAMREKSRTFVGCSHGPFATLIGRRRCAGFDRKQKDKSAIRRAKGAIPTVLFCI